MADLLKLGEEDQDNGINDSEADDQIDPENDPTNEKQTNE